MSESAHVLALDDDPAVRQLVAEYLSQNDLRLHFGLGDHRQVDKVEIFWPSGRTETLTNLEADHFYCVNEGSGVVPCSRIRPPVPPSTK